MKVRLTEQKLKSFIRQGVKEAYDSLGQSTTDNLFDPKFIDVTKNMHVLFKKPMVKLKEMRMVVLMIKMICKEWII